MKRARLFTKSLTKNFGALTVTDDVSIDIFDGEIHAIIGPNGAGKTTLINQLSGELAPDFGEITFDQKNVTAMPVYRRSRAGLLRSYQITSVFEEFTALENTTLAAMGTRQHGFEFWAHLLQKKDLTAIALEALDVTQLTDQANTPAKEL